MRNLIKKIWDFRSMSKEYFVHGDRNQTKQVSASLPSTPKRMSILPAIGLFQFPWRCVLVVAQIHTNISSGSICIKLCWLLNNSKKSTGSFFSIFYSWPSLLPSLFTLLPSSFPLPSSSFCDDRLVEHVYKSPHSPFQCSPMSSPPLPPPASSTCLKRDCSYFKDTHKV